MFGYRNQTCPTYAETKECVGQAFKALRKQGFVAHQSFTCCRSCAGAALDTAENQGKPAVYFTQQDTESFKQSGEVYVGFGVVGGTQDIADVQVGSDLANALRAAGLEVEWDGSSMTRVLVKGLKAPEPEATYLDLVGA